MNPAPLITREPGRGDRARTRLLAGTVEGMGWNWEDREGDHVGWVMGLQCEQVEAWLDNLIEPE